MFKLKLNNYRGFLNEEFNFSRVNILIGENSAGKSSILKFLLALKQSLRTPNNKESNITLAGDDADLGNYKEIIFNHEINRNLYFSFEFQEDYFDFFLKETLIGNAEKKEIILNYFDGKVTAPTIIDFELSSDLSSHRNVNSTIFNKKLGKIHFIHEQDNKAEQDIYLIGENPLCTINFNSVYHNEDFLFENIGYEKQAFLTIIDGEMLKESIENIVKNKEDSDRIYWVIAFMLISQNYIKLHLARIEYINPLLSESAKRIYLSGDKRNITKIRDIKDLTDYLSTNTVNKKFKEDLSKTLSDFGIADAIYVKQGKDGYTRELRVTVNGLDNNIKDVGFGVSLQLPIFAQALISENTTIIKHGNGIIRKGETLLIEQPEVHLHPSLQAKFIDTLLQISGNNVYFIETHSEHIIRKLQLIVKEKKYSIKSEDISIHYFRKDEKNMVKSFHEINQETGKLNPKFPKGFYDVSYDLAFQLMD